MMIHSQLNKSANVAHREFAMPAMLAAVVVSFLTVSPVSARAIIGSAAEVHAPSVGNGTNALTAASIELTIAPVVSGTPTVGERFATTTGTWSPRSVTISIQWLSDGVDIPGAIYSTYRPAAADVGKRLSTAVTASKPGYPDRTATSQQSDPIRLGKVRVEPNTLIRGEPRVGATLFANTGTSTCCSVTLSLEWLRDGVVISGATSESYVLVQEDVAKRIRLRVTGSAPGYIPSTVTSPATAPIAAD